MNNQFGSEEEVQALMDWEEKHPCASKYAGAIGGRFTYMFTPTSIGTVCKIKCSCGEEFDGTRYDWW